MGERWRRWLDQNEAATFNSGLLSLNVRDDGMTNLVAAPVSETFSIVGTCINCTAPASLLATITVIAIGVTLALRAERRSGTSRNA